MILAAEATSEGTSTIQVLIIAVFGFLGIVVPILIGLRSSRNRKIQPAGEPRDEGDATIGRVVDNFMDTISRLNAALADKEQMILRQSRRIGVLEGNVAAAVTVARQHIADFRSEVSRAVDAGESAEQLQTRMAPRVRAMQAEVRELGS